MKGNAIFCIDCLIPKATVGFAHFKVEDKDLSECWSQAEDHLNPVADLHFHPGKHKPTASTVDEENSLRQAGLYHIFNIETSKVLKKLSPNPVSANNSCFTYNIDAERTVSFHLNKKMRFAPDIFYEQKIKKALWGSLIYPSNANSYRVAGYVVEHRYVSDDDVQVTRYEDIETMIMGDEEVSELTGWPLEKVKLQFDEDVLEAKVALNYRPHTYYWGSYGSSYYSHGYEYNSYPVVVAEKQYGNYPVVVNTSHCKKKAGRQFQFLSEDSNLHDVAELLKEVAALIQDNHGQQFYYLESGADTREILKALKECAKVIEEKG